MGKYSLYFELKALWRGMTQLKIIKTEGCEKGIATSKEKFEISKRIFLL